MRRTNKIIRFHKVTGFGKKTGMVAEKPNHLIEELFSWEKIVAGGAIRID